MDKQLGIIGSALETERREELRNLHDRLHQMIMNIPVDLSATAPVHHIGFKAGHKQARHAIAEGVSKIFSELEDK